MFLVRKSKSTVQLSRMSLGNPASLLLYVWHRMATLQPNLHVNEEVYRDPRKTLKPR
jgi:hypothetical protein